MKASTIGALAAILVVAALATGASAQADDAFALDSQDLAPDFDSPPDLAPGDAVVLVEGAGEELDRSADELLGADEPASPTPEPEPAADPATRSATAQKSTPVPGVALLLAGIGALALARSRRA